MVDILLLQTISILIASAGVFVAAIYYIFQIRHQTRFRETDLEIRMNPVFNLNGIEWVQAMRKVTALEYKDYDDFVKKYGTLSIETPITVAVATICNWFEAVGYLLKRNLVSADYLWDCHGHIGIFVWEKLKPVIEGHRKQYNMPGLWKPFEYFCNEMKKREQKGVKSG